MATPSGSVPFASSCSAMDVPYTTQQYRKRKIKQQQLGVHTRKYTKKSDKIMCKKCVQERTSAIHRQYFGNWYCSTTATTSFEAWKELLMDRGYGRRKDE
ncbi:hypothetical protein DPMN_090518 [Dreissena polymorpha]|uniref:Uncharacterized protein n=1 Tax=Dreissena polymorpha TaxID=45954 RepID=A0A9D4QYA2_DREPO|nr:hypothetical protein DPMN_090518 [Dreissena polymorpha]